MRLPIKEIEKLRDEEKYHEVFDLLDALILEKPDEPELCFEYASTLARLGRLGDAIPYYRKAIDLKVKGSKLAEAYLGLGAALRALGKYAEAAEVLGEGSRKFPHHAALQAFNAIAQYNTGHNKTAVATLLKLLSETSKDRQIRAYQKELLLYSEDLDKTWPEARAAE